VFSRSYQALPAEQARLFRLLGSHPGPDFDLHAAAALAGTDLATTSALLDGLTRAHLIDPAGPGRYSMHDLLTGYALDLVDHRPETGPLRRVVHFYTCAAERAMDVIYPSDRDRRPRLDVPEGLAVPAIEDATAARAWLDAERANVLGGVRLAEASGWAREVGDLAMILWRDLDAQAHNEDALALQHLAFSAAKADGDTAAEADALRNLSTAYRTAGHYEASLDFAEQCVRLRRVLGDVRGEAAALNSVGITAGLLGRYGAAVEAYQRSLVLRRETGDRRSEAAVLQNLAVTCMRSGALDHVEEHLTQALALFREVGDRLGEGHALNNLGDLHQMKGQPAVALDHHEQGLALYREHGVTDGEADALNGIGRDHIEMGRPEVAMPFLEQALDIAGRRQHGILTHIHNSLGVALRALDRADEARRHYEQARTLAVGAGDQFEEAVALVGAAETLVPGDFEGARRLWERALAIYRQLGLPDAERIEARIAAHPC
jgi:tetratricopeptide (TPR) repeat protein